jgi:hypothetical protein
MKPLPSSAAAESKTWAMNALQVEFDRVVREASEAGKALTAKQVLRLAESSAKGAGAVYYRALAEAAPEMLVHQRKETSAFEARNFRRWRKAFDLLETIWASCEELGRAFNQHHRPEAVAEQDYLFEVLTYLHAKSLLVTSEVICLLRGGFADGALTRWRTLHEVNVVGALIVQEGQELAVRYLAYSRVQAWKAKCNGAENVLEDDDCGHLRSQAEEAIARFDEKLRRRNGWACDVTGKKNPSFEDIRSCVGREDEKSLYREASLHVHGNHRAYNDLLAMCEAQEDVLLVGPSNSGMVAPLTLAAMSLVESTSRLLLSKPNLDRAAFVHSLLRMAGRMNKLATGLERRTLIAAQRRRTA